MFPYPLNYFSSIGGFKAAFRNRNQLSWPQLIFTTLFLISLTACPLAIQHAQKTSYPLETFIEGVYTPLTNEVLSDLKENATIKDETFYYTGQHPRYETATSLVLLGQDTASLSTQKLLLYFDRDALLIQNKGKKLARISYQYLTTASFSSKQLLTKTISQSWYQENKLPINLFLILSATFLIGINFLIIVAGSTFFLYLTKKSALFSFRTVKECYHFTLNSLGLATIVATFGGLLGQSLSTMIFIQNSLFVLFVAMVFYKTHFREEKAS